MNQHSEIDNGFIFEYSSSSLEIPEEASKSIYVAKIQLLSGSNELSIENPHIWKRFMLTKPDYDRLQSLGLKGSLSVVGCSSHGSDANKARALIVARCQIKEAIDLPQPDECDVVYYQVGDAWQKFPEDAPVLKKRFRLSIDPEHKNCTCLFTEAYFGSSAGAGGGRTFCW